MNAPRFDKKNHPKPNTSVHHFGEKKHTTGTGHTYNLFLWCVNKFQDTLEVLSRKAEVQRLCWYRARSWTGIQQYLKP